jgi:hypothetical protein
MKSAEVVISARLDLSSLIADLRAAASAIEAVQDARGREGARIETSEEEDGH